MIETNAPAGAVSTSQACPACRETTPHRLLYRKNGCDVWQCRSCGLGRAEDTGFDPHAYYTGDYFSGHRSDGYSDYRAAEPVLRREFARSVALVRDYCPTGRLLDLGCAYGFFLKEAAPYFDVAGIELAEEAAAACRSAGLNVLSGVADEANMARIGKVDVITLFDVIEHLPQPHETLALCERYLKPGGIIMITTGDFASPLARLAGARWRLMTPPQHLWFLTPESMRRSAAALGLSLERCDHPAKVVPLSLILFQVRRMLGFGGAPITAASRIGIPVNLFDAMRIVLRKPVS
ncbi:MAG TPA: class I SAM-dependent methyltransferase [Xanthobacteraceae bacterium]|jgi:SAM-dependent methyltransferase